MKRKIGGWNCYAAYKKVCKESSEGKRLILLHPGAGEGDRTLVVSLGSFCSTIELHPRWVGIIPGYGWLFLALEIDGDITGMAVRMPCLLSIKLQGLKVFKKLG